MTFLECQSHKSWRVFTGEVLISVNDTVNIEKCPLWKFRILHLWQLLQAKRNVQNRLSANSFHHQTQVKAYTRPCEDRKTNYFMSFRKRTLFISGTAVMINDTAEFLILDIHNQLMRGGVKTIISVFASIGMVSTCN